MSEPVLRKYGRFAAMMAIISLAALFRLTDLGNRAMHCDEAVQAVKFGRLLEQGHYEYDLHEYHGPSLYYLTLPIARLLGRRTVAEVRESDLRLVPAMFGILLVALVWLLRHDLGGPATLAAGLLSAVSSSLVFYSRYYIHEMLLIGFSFLAILAIWRLTGRDQDQAINRARRPAWYTRFWLIVLGVSLGLMHATKETCVISFLAMTVAVGTTLRPFHRFSIGQRLCGCVVITAMAALISACFYSSWFQHPRGVLDSFTTYSQYVTRAMGDGSGPAHTQRWDYYLRVLFFWRHEGDHLWTEAIIPALAAVGVCFAFAPRQAAGRRAALARFLTIYVVVLIAVYSALPYKTPWCALGFMHGLVLLAGIGFGDIWGAARTVPRKTLVSLFLAIIVVHLSWQSWQASFVRCDDPRNPYNYSPTSRDVAILADRIHDIVAAQDPAMVTVVEVVCQDDDYWPLPWHLRDLPLVAWHDGFPASANPDIVITQPALRDQLAQRLFIDPPPGQRRLFLEMKPESDKAYWFLRPNVPLIVYVRLDVWEAYQRNRKNRQ